MTRALVTGSTGFLGSTLVAALNERGIEALGLRRGTSPDEALEGLKLTTAVGDILDPPSLAQAMASVDWVFHVAAISDHRNSSPDAIYRANVEGARNVFQAALRAGVKRLVFTSSSAALGVAPAGKAMLDERDRFNLKPAEFPYGHSKHLAEEALHEFVQKGLDAVSVLPSAVMGPRDLKFISGELLIQALKGRILALPKGGLNYIDVRDCAAGHIAAAERGRTGERYILAGTNLTHRRTMEIVRDVLGTRVPPFDIPSRLLPIVAHGVDLLRRLGTKLPISATALRMGGRRLYYDSSKASGELSLRARPFAESVIDTYRWYADHGYLERRGIRAVSLPTSSPSGLA